MKKNVFARWFAVLVVIGVSTVPLLLWRVLIAQQRPQIKQTIKLDAAIAKKPIAAPQESASGSLIFAGSGGNLPIIVPLVKEFRQSHPQYRDSYTCKYRLKRWGPGGGGWVHCHRSNIKAPKGGGEKVRAHGHPLRSNSGGNWC